MKKDNYILSVIDEITEVLQKNEYVRERYYNDVAWLQEKAKFIKKKYCTYSYYGNNKQWKINFS